jgi:Domain of unknown function (DUF4407)
MTEKNLSLSQREIYVPGSFTEFLWWLSTAEKEILTDCVVDRNRYKIIGMIVLATWAFATLSWTYFFSTVITSAIMYVPLGFFMGFVILCIDRALIKGINKFNRNKFTPIFFRGILALTIGTFMAQPAVLYMFDKEIRLQISLDNEKKKLVKRQELDSLYLNRKSELNSQKLSLTTGLKEKYALVQTARESFIQEADGTGGTGKIGIEEIAHAKKAEYQKLEKEYEGLAELQQPRIDEIDKELSQIESNIKKEEQVFTQYLNDGFLTRIEALNNLLTGNSALAFRYYLILIILMLIELMPVIAKSLLPSGSYDEKVFMREELEKDMAFENIRKEKELKELYNTLAKEKDSKAIQDFFSLTQEDRNEKMRSFANRWKDDKYQTFDGMWEKIKREILSKQEN